MNDLTKRAKQAAEIAAHPGQYKICEGCESILKMGAATCPNCGSYRFDSDPQRIVAQAKILGSRPKTSITPEDLV